MMAKSDSDLITVSEAIELFALGRSTSAVLRVRLFGSGLPYCIQLHKGLESARR